MTQWEAGQLIEQEFLNNWVSRVEFFFQNAPKAKDLPATYLNILSFGDSEINTCANTGKFRILGTLIAEIRTQLHIGDSMATQLAQEFVEIFRNKDIGGINFGVARFNKGNRGSHFGIDVNIAYSFDNFV